MDIITAYQELGSYRAAAKLCGTTDKTVKQIVERQQLGQLAYRTPPRPAHNTDSVRDLIHQRVAATDGRITAKRLLPRARAAGYAGSARNFRRAVAAIKAQWRLRRRVYRPWVPSPGEHLVIDWGQEGNLQIFCAVLAWSRYRFVRFAADQRRDTTLRLLAGLEDADAGHITHTGMYIGAGKFINATTWIRPVVQICDLSDAHWTRLLVACRRLK